MQSSELVLEQSDGTVPRLRERAGGAGPACHSHSEANDSWWVEPDGPGLRQIEKLILFDTKIDIFLMQN